MTALADPPTAQSQPSTEQVLRQTLSPDEIGRRITENLCSVYVTIHRPAGRPMAEALEMETRNARDGTAVRVDADKTTGTHWKIDVHPLWRQIDANRRLIENTLFRFSASDSIKGDHLVSVFKVAEMINAMRVLREDRIRLAAEIEEKWDTEVVPAIQREFPDVFWQIEPRLPKRGDIRHRFGVEWVIRPLTTINPEHLDLRSLSQDDAARVISQTQDVMREVVVQRFQSMFDQIFGEIMDLCRQINEGAFENGRSRPVLLDDLLIMLERVSNFSAFATPEVLQATQNARNVINTQIGTADQLARNQALQQALRTTMAPVLATIREMEINQMPGGGRAGRSISI